MASNLVTLTSAPICQPSVWHFYQSKRADIVCNLLPLLIELKNDNKMSTCCCGILEEVQTSIATVQNTIAIVQTSIAMVQTT